MYLYGAIRSYVEAGSSGSPTPGGGSIAALAGALGMSMACMAANFTVGKKKFKDVEEEVQGYLAECAEARDELLKLMDEDVAAYGTVSAAYGMPRKTDGQKQVRAEAIKTACRAAMAAPMVAARSCAIVVTACERLVDIGNKNLITDVGVSVLAAEAALRAAALNVEVNLGPIGD